MSPSREDDEPELGDKYDSQFTWMEGLLLPYMMVMYLLTWGVCISIIVEKHTMDEPPSGIFYYILFFVVSHILAGIKNLQCHYREKQVEKSSNLSWIIHILFIPFSPVIRYISAVNYGRKEGHTVEGSLMFVNECIKVAVLRMFDSLLCCAPFVILLLRDDVWNRSSDWQLFIYGTNPSMQCYPYCNGNDIEYPKFGWPISRMLILASQIAMSLTFYNMAVKRFQHLERPEYFEGHKSGAARAGKVNIFGTVVLFASNYAFAASRLLGYSMVVTTAGYYFILVICLKWFINIAWHMLTTFHFTTSIAVRTFSSFTMGIVWLYGLTNDAGGYQLGRYLVYYFVAFAETCLCCTIWFLTLKGSGDFFTSKAVWAVLILLLTSAVLLCLYYSTCHPGNPSVSRRGLLCCSADRREGVAQSFYETPEYGGIHKTHSDV
ncbi:UNVERIFIED_CONTAM: hypothetical protein RMT77_015505 [Armadillidium vulgare]